MNVMGGKWRGSKQKEGLTYEWGGRSVRGSWGQDHLASENSSHSRVCRCRRLDYGQRPGPTRGRGLGRNGVGKSAGHCAYSRVSQHASCLTCSHHTHIIHSTLYPTLTLPSTCVIPNLTTFNSFGDFNLTSRWPWQSPDKNIKCQLVFVNSSYLKKYLELRFICP